MKPITVLIVDDSNVIRTLFSIMLSDVPDIQVVDTAVDALDAREKIKRLNPDVLTLDIEMPKLDGLSFLEKIMALRPMPVLMISTLTQKGAGATLKALELGAVDYLSKPLGSNAEDAIKNLKDELVAKIRMAARANVRQRHTGKQNTAKIQPLSYQPSAQDLHSLIAIGSSTGGVEALREILPRLPANTPPIVMVQHMPKQFTGSFAERLNGLSSIAVSEAVDGTRLERGHAYLAPGDQHMTISKHGNKYTCHLHDGETVSGHRPSVDVLFTSVAEVAGEHAIGVILTGMGRDGASGMHKMRQAGAYNIGQNESTCVVYGMPKSAMAIGAVNEECALLDIPARILASLSEKVAHGK